MTRLAANDVGLKRGGATLLSDLSLGFAAGETVAIVGPNGAGKSLFLKILAGIERPTSGGTLLNGRAMSGYSARERARHIGYVPQQFQPHWDFTVFDLVRLGAERAAAVSQSNVILAIEAAGLGPLRDRRWSSLSGGERARVLLTAVTAAGPSVLLADEPAASLDAKYRIEVCRALAHRQEERLSIVVMHDLDLAFHLFDRVILMGAGRVVADGPAAEVAQSDALDRVFGVTFERVGSKGAVGLRVVLD
jgi:ABC-type cobalamin/Fe3+-siderophores transport system ATPase subunit